MSRVMLFVDRYGSDGTPKVPRGRARYSSEVEDELASYGVEKFFAGIAERENARRWWLVECQNAEAGRARIAHADSPYCTPDTCDCGGALILAHGSRAPREAGKP